MFAAPVGGIRGDADTEQGAILPEAAAKFSLSWDMATPDAAPPFQTVSLPDELRNAIPRRRMEFLAGRFCAMEALRHLDPERPAPRIGRDERGAPIWPSGIVGSITHTDGYVSAAVGRAEHAISLGIDSERVVSLERARNVSLHVCWPSELMQGRHAGLDRLESVTLVFSAKEAIFKCLFPLTGTMFYYHDVRMEFIDGSRRVFRARLVKTLSSEFRAGTMLEGRFTIEDSLVHTGVWLGVC